MNAAPVLQRVYRDTTCCTPPRPHRGGGIGVPAAHELATNPATGGSSPVGYATST
jgi:hypothetical protein